MGKKIGRPRMPPQMQPTKKAVDPKAKRLILVDPRSERMLILLRWLEAKGGKAQVPSGVIAQETGMPKPAVLQWFRWLELYGAVHIERRVQRTFGAGNQPYLISTLMSVADYERDCMELREVVRARLRPPKFPRKGRVFPRNVAALDPDEMELIKAQAVAEVRAAIAQYAPLPPLAPEPMPYDEVEAWGTAFNA